MRGLLEKDYRLMAQRKKTAIIYVVVAFMLSFTMDSSFIVSYFTMIGALLGISTISLDEYDNGYPFLMTLPISAKLYAIEKYVFSAITLSVFWIFAMLVQFLSFFMQKQPFILSDVLFTNLLFLPVFLLIIAILLPIQLKFGADKGRIVMMILFGIAFSIGVLGERFLKFLVKDLHIDMEGIIRKLDSMPRGAVGAAICISCLLLTMLSMLISIQIMQKKEF